MFIMFYKKAMIAIFLFLLLTFAGMAQITDEDTVELYYQGDVGLLEGLTLEVKADNSQESYEINGASALAALEIVCAREGFEYKISDEWSDSWGLFVSEIDGKTNEGDDGWQFWPNYPENSDPPMISADNYILKNGDVLYWCYGGYGTNPDNSDMVMKLHIVKDDHSPDMEVISPKKGGIYLSGNELSVLPLPFSIVIGELPIKVNAADELTMVGHVDVTISGEMIRRLNTVPFEFVISGIGSGLRPLKITASDMLGNDRVVEINCFFVGN